MAGADPHNNPHTALAIGLVEAKCSNAPFVVACNHSKAITVNDKSTGLQSVLVVF